LVFANPIAEMLAFTRAVPPSIARCELTHLPREPIDWARAEEQHRRYEEALESLGCRVLRLPALPDFPDSVFVEDTAIVLDECAVITRPGAPSRRGETPSVAQALREHRPLLCIESPGTIDGGDVLRVGRRIFVGLSTRTNRAAIEQLTGLIAPMGYDVVPIAVEGCLHLKSAVSDLGDGTLLIAPSLVAAMASSGLTTIEGDPSEPGGSNVLLVNGTVICPASAPRTRERLLGRGRPVLSLDVSELAKAEAGLTCCSLLVNVAAD
jgi:dimethylargininase